jgi:hypothetical protein
MAFDIRSGTKCSNIFSLTLIIRSHMFQYRQNEESVYLTDPEGSERHKSVINKRQHLVTHLISAMSLHNCSEFQVKLEFFQQIFEKELKYQISSKSDR